MCQQGSGSAVRTCYPCGEWRVDALAAALWNGKRVRPLGCSPPVQKGGATTSSKQPKTEAVSTLRCWDMEPMPSIAADASVPIRDLVNALQLLQSVMSVEDFSMYEKLVLPSERRKRRSIVSRSSGKKCNLRKDCRNRRPLEQVAKFEHHLSRQM